MMPGLDPGIFVSAVPVAIAGSGPAMMKGGAWELSQLTIMPGLDPGILTSAVPTRGSRYAAAFSALGSSSASTRKSSGVPAVTRMQRLSGATPGIRTNTPAATRASSTRFA